MTASPNRAYAPNEGRLAPASRTVLYLLYHELSARPGAYKYALSVSAFRKQLLLFQRLRTTEARGPCPEITFDDGHLSNFDQALPSLAEAGLNARFFITAGWTAQRPEYMNWEQLFELARAGHRIGAHGWSHKLLTRCTDSELDTELGRARAVLEDKLGFPITDLSLPGGRFDARVLTACRRHGYTHIFSSVPRVETVPAQETIGRLNLRSDASAEWLQMLFATPVLIDRLERRYRIKAAAQRALGDTLYGKLWAFLNGARPSSEPPHLP